MAVESSDTALNEPGPGYDNVNDPEDDIDPIIHLPQQDLTESLAPSSARNVYPSPGPGTQADRGKQQHQQHQYQTQQTLVGLPLPASINLEQSQNFSQQSQDNLSFQQQLNNQNLNYRIRPQIQQPQPLLKKKGGVLPPSTQAKLNDLKSLAEEISRGTVDDDNLNHNMIDDDFYQDDNDLNPEQSIKSFNSSEDHYVNNYNVSETGFSSVDESSLSAEIDAALGQGSVEEAKKQYQSHVDLSALEKEIQAIATAAQVNALNTKNQSQQQYNSGNLHSGTQIASDDINNFNLNLKQFDDVTVNINQDNLNHINNSTRDHQNLNLYDRLSLDPPHSRGEFDKAITQLKHRVESIKLKEKSEVIQLRSKVEQLEATLQGKETVYNQASEDYRKLKDDTQDVIGKLSREINVMSMVGPSNFSRNMGQRVGNILKEGQQTQQSPGIGAGSGVQQLQDLDNDINNHLNYASNSTNRSNSKNQIQNQQNFSLEDPLKLCEDLQDALESLSATRHEFERKRLENEQQKSRISELERKLQDSQDQEMSYMRTIQGLEIENKKLSIDKDSLESKLEEVKEKKRSLVNKIEIEKSKDSMEIQERINTEVTRLKETMDRDVNQMRVNLNELHSKEVTLLQERLDYITRERDQIQSRLIDEENRVQETQVALSSLQSQLTNEIIELQGKSRLKQFEIEKFSLSYEETLGSLQKANEENASLKAQLDTMKSEWFELQTRSKHDLMQLRNEGIAMREQLRLYKDAEQEMGLAMIANGNGNSTTMSSIVGLDNNIKEKSDDRNHNINDSKQQQSYIPSLQIGIQENLSLVKKLRAKAIEVSELRTKLELSEKEKEQATSQKELAERAAQHQSEPRKYLTEMLRKKEQEVVEIKREKEMLKRELKAMAKRYIDLQKRFKDMSCDLKMVLFQREKVRELQNISSDNKIHQNQIQNQVQNRIPGPGAITNDHSYDTKMKKMMKEIQNENHINVKNKSGHNSSGTSGSPASEKSIGSGMPVEN